MLNYNSLMEKYPSIPVIEPDLERIKFGYALKQKCALPNRHIYIGMLKYILKQNDKEKYKKEFELLYDMLEL